MKEGTIFEAALILYQKLIMWQELTYFVFLFFLGLTKLGNIEEFFNQNFFKKTRKSEPKERSYPKDEFGGSPESDYEPSLTSFQSEAWNDHKISGR